MGYLTERHLQGDGSVALAAVLGARDKSAHVALQNDGAAVEQLCADLVQLCHLARPQEDLQQGKVSQCTATLHQHAGGNERRRAPKEEDLTVAAPRADWNV